MPTSISQAHSVVAPRQQPLASGANNNGLKPFRIAIEETAIKELKA
jgi:hypothetical protein